MIACIMLCIPAECCVAESKALLGLNFTSALTNMVKDLKTSNILTTSIPIKWDVLDCDGWDSFPLFL